MDRVTTSRRALLRAATTAIAYSAGAAIVGTGMALAGEAHSETVVSANTPFRIAEARYRAAEKHFNSLPGNLELDDPERFRREEEAYLDTVTAVDEAPVSDWQEFAAQFDIAFDGGVSLPNDKLIHKLLADAKRLSGRA